MNHEEKLDYLINYLLTEGGYRDETPSALPEKKRLLRALFNVRPPKPISAEFLRIQDEYLSEVLSKKQIADAKTFSYRDGIAVWRGDITLLKADGIVNAANSRLLGCFAPCHSCIDNAIHTYAGVQLRLECDEIMKAQNFPEPTGQAKITGAYNLPSKYVLHTVGPIVFDGVTDKKRSELKSCYESCLALADEKGLKSLAFCCISTGEFRFPNDEAAKIAVDTVRSYLRRTGSKIKVIFNVFKEIDNELYLKLLR